MGYWCSRLHHCQHRVLALLSASWLSIHGCFGFWAGWVHCVGESQELIHTRSKHGPNAVTMHDNTSKILKPQLDFEPPISRNKPLILLVVGLVGIYHSQPTSATSAKAPPKGGKGVFGKALPLTQ